MIGDCDNCGHSAAWHWPSCIRCGCSDYARWTAIVVAILIVLSGCGDRPRQPETCEGAIASNQAELISEECSLYGTSSAGPLLVDSCIKDVARQRILIAIEYAKVCK